MSVLYSPHVFNGFDSEDDEEDTNPGIGPIQGPSSGGTRIALPNQGGVLLRDDGKTTTSDGNKSSIITPSSYNPPRSSTSYGGYGAYGGYGGNSSYSYDSRKEAPTITDGPTRLFVYCTLRRRGPLNVIVARDKFECDAKTAPEYRMINIKDQYPAVLSGGKNSITGEVYLVQPRTIKFLDKIMGHPYNNFRREEIKLEDGTVVQAYLMLKWKTPFREEDIHSGDWWRWKMDERERNRQKKEEEEKKKAEEAKRWADMKDSYKNSVYTSGHRYGGNVSNAPYSESAARQASAANSSSQPATTEKKQYMSIVNTKRDRVGANSEKLAPRPVHVDQVDIIDLRILLRDNGTNPDSMRDDEVRTEVSKKYGNWLVLE